VTAAMERATSRGLLVALTITPFLAAALAGGASQAFAVLYLFVAGFGLFALSPLAWLAAAIVLLLAVPGEAQILFTGVSYLEATGGVNLHVLTYFTLGAALCLATVRIGQAPLQSALFRRQALVFGLLLLIEAAIEGLRIRGVGPSNQLPDVYVGPILFYFLAVSALRSKPSVLAVRNFFLGLTALLAVFAVFEFLTGSNAYLSGSLDRQDVTWYRFFMREASSGEPYRVMTALGHPLTNAAYFLASFSLVVFGARAREPLKAILQLALAILFLTAVVLTFSRAAFLLATAGVAWYVLRQGHGSVLVRVVAIGALLPVTYLFLEPILGLLAGRGFGFGDASAGQRAATLIGLSRNFGALPLLGYGPQNMEEAAAALIGGSAGTSLEIGYVIVLLQYGVGFLALYAYGVTIGLIGDASQPRQERALARFYLPPLVLLIAYFGASNTIGIRSTIHYLLFLLLAFHVAADTDQADTCPARERRPDLAQPNPPRMP